jgi:hypothetical protein
MKNIFNNKKLSINFLKAITIALLILLPYYLFEGKLFLGGDDTRLFYSYPYEFMQNVTYFAWYNVSTIGINVSNQYLLPFLTFWTAISFLITDKIILSYLAFSLPLIIGFIYFPKFVGELFTHKNEYKMELFVGSLLYILSPILIFDQLFIFLTSVWLIGVFPAIGYYYLKYVKTGEFHYLYIGLLISIIFSFTLLAIPWVLGLLLPLGVGSIVLLILSTRNEIINFLKRTSIFIGWIIFTQAFWFIGFIWPYLFKDSNSFAQRFLSESFLESFRTTINATATGSIIYPLLNLFHRQIAFDYEWKLKNEFVGLYDHTFMLNAIFLIVIGVGVFSYKKFYSKFNRTLFLYILFSFILSLFFFTVNIGPLKNMFLFMGNIPGFVMFRNFYDKFAPGYVFLYSVLFTISLILMKMRFPAKSKWLSLILLGIILLNFSTVKSTVNSPLWTTDDVYKTLIIPSEYTEFMNTIKNNVSPTNSMLSLPFGAASYTVIKDETSNNVYVGTSPVKVFSGVNDISGHLSFSFSEEANTVDKVIIDRKYNEFNEMLYKHNINYVIHTKNIPDQVLKSYAFGQDTIASQDAEFLSAITHRKLLSSKDENYDLYSTKKKNSLISSANITFKKINAVTYKILFKNLDTPQKLYFNDSYHAKWNLFLDNEPNSYVCTAIVDSIKSTKECKSEFRFFNISELRYLWKNPVFEESHVSHDGINNVWTIDPKHIVNTIDKKYYTVNKDGSINVEMTLYFKPQLFLYYGSIISIVTILAATFYQIRIYFKKNEKK